ncbi:MAG: GNAT family N-acetyltransferase [bacterium]|nr:GNAT family N-acetyltransferase [bacterium]
MNAPYTVRPAVPLDAAGYIRLIKDVLREQPPVDTPYAPDEFDPSADAMRDRIQIVSRSDNDLFLVAEAGHKVIGALTCAGGTLKADRHKTDLGVYVAAGWRDRGVGTALLAYTVAWAARSPVVARVELEVFAANARAIHLYEKFGFQREGLKRGLYQRAGQPLDMLIMARLFPKG